MDAQKIILFLLFFSCSLMNVGAQTEVTDECNNASLEHYHNQIKKYNASFQSSNAFMYKDSLDAIASNEKLRSCYSYISCMLDFYEALELQADYENALAGYHEILKHANQEKYYDLMAEIYISIARIHEIIGRPADAHRNLVKAYGLIMEHNLKNPLSRYCVRNASYHRIYGHIDSARHYALEAIRLGRLNKIARSELDGNLLMGILSDKPNIAIKYFSEAVKLYLERDAFYGAASQTLNIARSYFKMDDPIAAKIHLDIALDYSDKMLDKAADYHYIVNACYNLKKELFEASGQIDSAYHYQSIAHQHELKGLKIIDQQYINEIEIENAVQNELLISMQYKSEMYLYVAIIISILVILLLMVIYSEIIRKKNKQITIKNTALTRINAELNTSAEIQKLLFSEIHHRVKNNLQIIISIVSIKLAKTDQEEYKSFLMQLSNNINGIALIHDQLYKTEEFEKVSLDILANNLFENFNILLSDNLKFIYTFNCDKITLNLDTTLPLSIICSELVNNSIKYARQANQKLLLELSITQNDGDYTLKYKDNGPGFSDEKFRSSENGMGTLVINNMVRQLKGEINTFNDKGAVTMVSFREKIISSL